MNRLNEADKEVRPRIAGWLFRLIRLGAAIRSITEQQWLTEAIQEKADREGFLPDQSDKEAA